MTTSMTSVRNCGAKLEPARTLSALSRGPGALPAARRLLRRVAAGPAAIPRWHPGRLPGKHRSAGVSAVVDAGEEIETYSEADILAFVHEIATRRDPGRILPYTTASPARIKHAAAIAQRLLETHLHYLRASPRTRGRRQHNAETFRLLEETNPGTLTLALAWLDAAFALLPPGTKDD